MLSETTIARLIIQLISGGEAQLPAFILLLGILYREGILGTDEYMNLITAQFPLHDADRVYTRFHYLFLLARVIKSSNQVSAQAD